MADVSLHAERHCEFTLLRSGAGPADAEMRALQRGARQSRCAILCLHFGSGWAWLVVHNDKLAIKTCVAGQSI